MNEVSREKLIEAIAQLAYENVMLKAERDTARGELRDLQKQHEELVKIHNECDC